MPGMPGMPGMPPGGQFDPAMMQEMMNNPMVQQVNVGGWRRDWGVLCFDWSVCLPSILIGLTFWLVGHCSIFGLVGRRFGWGGAAVLIGQYF